MPMALPLISLLQKTEDQTGRVPTSRGEKVGKPGLAIPQKMLEDVMDANPRSRLTSAAGLWCRHQTLVLVPGTGAHRTVGVCKDLRPRGRKGTWCSGLSRSSQWPYCTVFKLRLGCGVFFWRDEHVLEPEVVPT